MTGGLAAVLKVGGSLSRSPALPDLCQEISRLGSHHRLLVIPGGGEFADLVRDFYARLRLSETTAHRMAILAMDQYGYLLGDLIPRAALAADLPEVLQIAEDGRVPVLLPAALMAQADPLPHSWQVTSDSIAAWVAGALHTSSLVLLKDVDGLYASDPNSSVSGELLPQVDITNLSTMTGGIDEHLSVVLAQNRVKTWVINGQYPHRLAELIEMGRTMGTCVHHN
jgi:aspartokinase-like uncharacterized kinase